MEAAKHAFEKRPGMVVLHERRGARRCIECILPKDLRKKPSLIAVSGGGNEKRSFDLEVVDLHPVSGHARASATTSRDDAARPPLVRKVERVAAPV